MIFQFFRFYFLGVDFQVPRLINAEGIHSDPTRIEHELAICYNARAWGLPPGRKPREGDILWRLTTGTSDGVSLENPP